LKPVPTMVIPPKAVSRLFDACAKRTEGADCPSLFDFGANYTIGTGNKYLNWAARAEKNGALIDLTGEQTGSNKQRQQEYEQFLFDLWLSRMTEAYQRSYRALMQTLDEAEEFCKDARKEIARRIEQADRELDRLREQIVVIDGEECWIRNGVIVGRNGLPSKLSKEKQDEALRAYVNDPKRKAAAERGGQVIDFRERNKELGAKIEEHEQCAKELRERAESKGMTKEEMDREEKELKEKIRSLETEFNNEMTIDLQDPLPAKTFDKKQSKDLEPNLDDDSFSGADTQTNTLSSVFASNAGQIDGIKQENTIASPQISLQHTARSLTL
jgi:hypothetical protein